MKRKLGKVVAVAISAVFCVFFMLAGMALLWMNRTWGALTTEEFFYTISTAGTGTSKSMVLSYTRFSLIAAIPLLILLIVGFAYLWKKKKPFRIFALTLPLVTLIFLGIAGWASWQKLGVSDYLYNQGLIGGNGAGNAGVAGSGANSEDSGSSSDVASSFIDANYVDPATVDLQFPEKKRNLIYIFIESMEVTSMDEANGGALSVNTIPELTNLARENETFSGTTVSAPPTLENAPIVGGFSALGSTWTVGAMFAQSSGLPLLLPFQNNGMSDQDTFLPGATLIGDILEEEGYTQQIIFGSDKAFGGRDNMYRDHGNFDIHDYYWAIDNGKIPKDYYVWWGFEDSKMFDFAKEDLAALSKSDEPFNYTLLTADTHFVGGYLCPDCPDTFEDQYANVMACSSKKVSSFVEWLKKQDFYENTTIVLAGDHPTMDGEYFHIDESYDRRVYFTIINGAATPEITEKRDYSTMDIFPTTLASLGVTIPGDRLGLGTNLYGTKKTLLEEYGEEELDIKLAVKSNLMTEMTKDIDIEKVQPDYTIDFQEKNEETGGYPYIITAVAKREYGTFVLKVWNSDESEDTAVEYIPEKTAGEMPEEEIYSTELNINRHGNKAGLYEIDLIWRDRDGEDKLISSTFVMLE
ncbi:MAG: LTA synthase family protein [Lachnospiraceae bacterium]|jgi:phosphoglycerol transferase|nr:LTA synthase family protein [Lachnospiraceae bacterium]